MQNFNVFLPLIPPGTYQKKNFPISQSTKDVVSCTVCANLIKVQYNARNYVQKYARNGKFYTQPTSLVYPMEELAHYYQSK